MIEIRISDELRGRCPDLRLACLSCNVHVREGGGDLQGEIEQVQARLRQQLRIEDISSHPVNGRTRDGYRACGKKPGRYRPSAEALLRRVLQGKGLYRISNAVDVINLVSISTGYSIGGYDQGRIQGDVELGIGKEGEPYEGLGRGVLNIHKMPVFRDAEGAFGSPTSDSARTNVRPGTQRFLMVFLDFGRDDEARSKAIQLAEGYLTRFCGGTDFKHWEV
jgi:DNA/RNA-binding domain of Phe-tRNA-synthetase-like protein